jgi:formate-dependent nitrite reductase membrane component NrfD
MFNFKPGLYLGLAIVLLGGLLHLSFLGKAERFWRMISSFKSSWISRGLVGVGVFSASAILYLIVASLTPAGSVAERVVLAVSLLGAIWICAYKGFVWAGAKGIPFWNSALLPAVFIAYAARGGIAVLFVVLLFGTQIADITLLEVIKLWIAISSGALVILYLAAMPNAGAAAQRSVSELIRGRMALSFYLGAVLFGLVVPIGLGLASSFSELPLALVGLIGVSSLIGDFYTIYSIARAGIYRPLSIFA